MALHCSFWTRFDGEQLDFVSFENPPVEEVAFAVQLGEAQLTVDDVVAIGRVLAEDLLVRRGARRRIGFA